MGESPFSKGIGGLLSLYRKGEAAPEEVIDYTLKRCEELSCLNAFITVMDGPSRDAARRSGRAWRRRSEPIPPLSGVPIAVKDNIACKGVRTTCASKILENFVPAYNATAVERLLSAGAIVVGKTNMDEFAMGSSSETSAFGPVSNPLDEERVAGGSSGGSAAAVAAGMVPAALGTDTGGSIRQPASFCGIVGMKPTYGRVSRFGLVAFASSLDQIGPMAGNVKDARLILMVISGRDPRDDTSMEEPLDTAPNPGRKGVKGMRCGLPVEFFPRNLREDIRGAIFKGIRFLTDEGVEVEEVSLPSTEYAISTYYLIATSEASSNLSRYDGVRYGLRVDQGKGLKELYRATRSRGFGWEVKRRIMLGTFFLSRGYYEEYYGRAQKVRRLITEEFEEIFRGVDFLITPTSPTPPFRKGERHLAPIEMYLSDIYTVSVNLASLPAISIPCGISEEGLPVGLQVIGRRGDDLKVLQVAEFLEEGMRNDERGGCREVNRPC